MYCIFDFCVFLHVIYFYKFKICINVNIHNLDITTFLLLFFFNNNKSLKSFDLTRRWHGTKFRLIGITNYNSLIILIVLICLSKYSNSDFREIYNHGSILLLFYFYYSVSWLIISFEWKDDWQNKNKWRYSHNNRYSQYWQ